MTLLARGVVLDAVLSPALATAHAAPYGAAEIFAAWQGADYIRTHDVAAVRDALAFLAAVTDAADAATRPFA